MAVVILEPRSATLVSSSTPTPWWRSDEQSILVMDVRMPHHAGIWLETDEKSFVGDITLSIQAGTIEAVQAILDLVEETDDSLGTADVVGSMRYSAARKSSGLEVGQKAAISLEAFVPPKHMANLLRHVRHGRFPRKIWLDVRGLRYRGAARRKSASLSWPRHSEQPVLLITNVSLEFPHRRQTEFSLVRAASDNDDADASSKASARAIDRLDPLFFRISGPLAWAVWGLLAVIVGAAFWIVR